MESNLYLIRHGITEGNIKKWFYGWTDVPLLPEGREKLTELKKEGIYPLVEEAAPVFTSEFRRTKETLAILYGNRPSTALADLDEFNFGRFEAHPLEDFETDPDYQKWLHDKTGMVRLGGGDSIRSFAARVGRGIETVEKAVRAYNKRAETDRPTTLVVCHGGVISQMMRQMFPDLPGTKWDWVPDPGMGFALRLNDGDPVSYTAIGNGETHEAFAESTEGSGRMRD